jgi:hypothetical protein
MPYPPYPKIFPTDLARIAAVPLTSLGSIGTLRNEMAFFNRGEIQEPEMKKFYVIGLAAATFLGLGSGIAVAQTVSGANPYQQGYAAGASAKEQNSFNAFDSGYQAGKVAQHDVESERQAASTLAYNDGYQAGAAQANRDRTLAYNEGYQAHAQQQRDATARAFDNGFDAGAERQARVDDEFP